MACNLTSERSFANNHIYHESFGELTPADLYLCKADTIFRRRKAIKRKAFEKRGLLHHQTEA